MTSRLPQSFRFVVLFCLLYGWGGPAPVQATGNNLLVVIADDVGIDSLALYNDDPTARFPPMPTVEALAARGTRFLNAYAYPTCSPTRTAMLTGRYGYRTGVLSPASNLLAADEVTLPEVFAAQPELGYQLASVGKWHLGGGATGPNTLGGWPHFSGSLGGGLSNYRNWAKTTDGVTTNVSMTYATRANVTDAIDWLNQQGDDPWLLWVGFNAGHTPLHLPPPALHNYGTLSGETADIEANPRPYFEAMMEALDHQFGRLLGAVDTNTTTVIFIGDNGTAGDVIQPPYDMRGRAKGSLYEGGTHVPLIIAGPDVVNPGRIAEEVVHCVDLFATLIELAGGTLPTGVELDARSLVPILQDTTFAPAETAVLVETDSLLGGGSGRALRDTTYKLVRRDGLSDELYDLTTDPLESSDLLEAVLDPAAQVAYDELSTKLDSRQAEAPTVIDSGYPVVDTGQVHCYDANGGYTIVHPSPGNAFSGQDAQYTGAHAAYTEYTNGVILDLNTGLIWQKTPDLTNKVSFADAVAGADTFNLGGFTDWRLPTLKELYSLIDFTGDTGSSANDAIPYINTNYFDFVYGDTSTERYIDAQYWSATEYVGTTMNGDATVFGVNFADGRIKGYPKVRPGGGGDNLSFVRYVRGNPAYGINEFVDNGDGTVTDLTTGLMWQQGGSGSTQHWEQALAYAEGLELSGYRDWRLPNAKELQSIVDYSRAPLVTGSAAIDTNVFSVSETESFYWTSTTHLDGAPATRGDYAVYICFGRALGWMEQPPGSGNYRLLDVHGAGAQRSDPKMGNPADFPFGHGPQGDVIRIYNYTRCVRAAADGPAGDADGDGLSDWYEFDYSGSVTSLVAGADDDGDGVHNGDEAVAGTIPTDPGSYLGLVEIAPTTNGTLMSWTSELGKTYVLERSPHAAAEYRTVIDACIAATPPLNEYLDPVVDGAAAVYRIGVIDE